MVPEVVNTESTTQIKETLFKNEHQCSLADELTIVTTSKKAKENPCKD